MKRHRVYVQLSTTESSNDPIRLTAEWRDAPDGVRRLFVFLGQTLVVLDRDSAASLVDTLRETLDLDASGAALEPIASRRADL